MATIVERRRSTIVQIGEDEIELVESDEEWPLDKQIRNVIEKKLGNRHNSKMSKNRSIGTIVIEPVASLLCSSLDDDVEGLPHKRYLLEDMCKLQEKVNDLRIEIMEQTEVLDDPVKRVKMEALRQRVEGVIRSDQKLAETSDGGKESCYVTADKDVDNEKNKAHSLNQSVPNNVLLGQIRRTTVAVAGGVLTVAGVVLIPCPIIPGCLIVYVGLLVLATEFEWANNALDTVKEPIEKWSLADYEEEDASIVPLEETTTMK